MQKHEIHKYKKVKFKSGYIIFKCMLPNCAHFLREELAEGRASICWRCGIEFILNKRNMIQTKPHCMSDECTREYKTRLNVILLNTEPKPFVDILSLASEGKK